MCPITEIIWATEVRKNCSTENAWRKDTKGKLSHSFDVRQASALRSGRTVRVKKLG